MPELDIGLADGDKLNFDQSFRQYNVKERNIWEEFLSI